MKRISVLLFCLTLANHIQGSEANHIQGSEWNQKLSASEQEEQAYLCTDFHEQIALDEQVARSLQAEWNRATFISGSTHQSLIDLNEQAARDSQSLDAMKIELFSYPGSSKKNIAHTSQPKSSINCVSHNSTHLNYAHASGNFNLFDGSMQSKDGHAEKESQNRALLDAVLSNDVGAALLLIKAGADKNFKNENNQTLLHISAENNYQDMARMLIKKRINLNTLDKKLRTAYMRAVECEHYEMVQLLIDANADTDI